MASFVYRKTFVNKVKFSSQKKRKEREKEKRDERI